MRLFQILGNQVNIIKDEQFYTDTVENYLLDGGLVEKDGEKMTVVVHDNQQDYCEVNGVVLPYPNDFFENIIDSIEMLMVKKEKRNEPSLEELKTAKLTILKSMRDTLEVEPITYKGNSFDYDEKARDRINAAIIALDMQTQLNGTEASLSWTTADNTEAIVTANDLRGIIANVALRSNELHIRYRELKDLVESAETKEDLDKIMWEEIDGN
jgi:hypothetical protein